MEPYELPPPVSYRFLMSLENDDPVAFTAYVQPMVVVFFRHVTEAVDNRPFDITVMREDWDKPSEQICRRSIQEAINSDLFINPSLNRGYLKHETAEWEGDLRRL